MVSTQESKKHYYALSAEVTIRFMRGSERRWMLEQEEWLQDGSGIGASGNGPALAHTSIRLSDSPGRKHNMASKVIFGRDSQHWIMTWYA